jgi:hypothetical protein
MERAEIPRQARSGLGSSRRNARDRERIIADYHSTVATYREAVSRLSGLTGAAFEKARKEAEKAREVCEKKRALLEHTESAG